MAFGGHFGLASPFSPFGLGFGGGGFGGGGYYEPHDPYIAYMIGVVPSYYGGMLQGSYEYPNDDTFGYGYGYGYECDWYCPEDAPMLNVVPYRPRRRYPRIHHHRRREDPRIMMMMMGGGPVGGFGGGFGGGWERNLPGIGMAPQQLALPSPSPFMNNGFNRIGNIGAGAQIMENDIMKIGR